MSKTQEVKIMHKGKGVIAQGKITHYEQGEASTRNAMVHFTPAIGEPGFLIKLTDWAWLCSALRIYELPLEEWEKTKGEEG